MRYKITQINVPVSTIQQCTIKHPSSGQSLELNSWFRNKFLTDPYPGFSSAELFYINDALKKQIKALFSPLKFCIQDALDKPHIYEMRI